MSQKARLHRDRAQRLPRRSASWPRRSGRLHLRSMHPSIHPTPYVCIYIYIYIYYVVLRIQYLIVCNAFTYRRILAIYYILNICVYISIYRHYMYIYIYICIHILSEIICVCLHLYDHMDLSFTRLLTDDGPLSASNRPRCAWRVLG